jgi:hypothetical protein
MSQDEDILGAKSSKKHGTIDAEDEIGDKGTGPQKLEEAKQKFKAKQPLTASLLLYEMLAEGAYPSTRRRSTTTWPGAFSSSRCTTPRSTTSRAS